MTITRGKNCRSVLVQKGQCGFVTIDFGCGKFHLPKSIAEQLLQQMVSSMDLSNIPFLSQEEKNIKTILKVQNG